MPHKGEYVALRQKDTESSNVINVTSDEDIRKTKENAELLTEIVSLERDQVDKSSQERSSGKYKEVYVPKITSQRFSLVVDPNTRSRQMAANSYRSVQISNRSQFSRGSNFNTETNLETKIRNIRESLERDMPSDGEPTHNVIEKPQKMNKWASDFGINKTKNLFIPAEKEVKAQYETALKPNDKANLDVKYSVSKNNYIDVNDTFNIDISNRKASKFMHQIESTAEDLLQTEEGRFPFITL